MPVAILHRPDAVHEVSPSGNAGITTSLTNDSHCVVVTIPLWFRCAEIECLGYDRMLARRTGERLSESTTCEDEQYGDYGEDSIQQHDGEQGIMGDFRISWEFQRDGTRAFDSYFLDLPEF